MSEPLPEAAPADDRPPRLLIGAMSGTSADGVDAALARITGRGLDMQAMYLGHVEQPYDPDLRKRIFALRESGHVELKELAALGREITLAYARAVEALLAQQSIQPSQIAAIAAHGQTLFHEVPDTIQWLDPSLLAAETGIAVVSDFRRADLAAGGQGAPLVPFADWILFRHPEKTRVILNIGGIANLTYLPAGGGIDEVIAFDTGPGNCISDWLARKAGVAGSFDDEGKIASSGEVIEPIQHAIQHVGDDEQLAWHRYVRQPAPKSTDSAEMISAWRELVQMARPFEPREGFPLASQLRTAVFATVSAINWALRGYCKLEPGEFGELVVGGGGTRNATLMEELLEATSSQGRTTGYHHRDHPLSSGSGTFARVWVDDWRLRRTDDLGLPSQAREAVAFAILGAATLDNEPSNVPSATGASKPVVLGSITPTP